MKDRIVITVAGPTASGKSHISALLEQFLTAVGFEVDVESTEDTPKFIKERLMEIIDVLADDKLISIKEQNIARPTYRD